MVGIVDVQGGFEAAGVRTGCPEAGDIFCAACVENDFFDGGGQIGLSCFFDDPVIFDGARAVDSDFSREGCSTSADVKCFDIVDAGDCELRIDHFDLRIEFGKKHIGVVADLPVADVVAWRGGGNQIDRNIDRVSGRDAAHQQLRGRAAH